MKYLGSFLKPTTTLAFFTTTGTFPSSRRAVSRFGQQAAVSKGYYQQQQQHQQQQHRFMMSSSKSSSRTIERVVAPTQNGPITRLIGTVDIDGAGTQHGLEQVDPFILLDYACIPKDQTPPFGMHPHRGHSVVTVLLQGKVTSSDSFRPSNEHHTIQGPASYFVDAGTGLFHDEISSIQDESDPSQHVKLFQLWMGVQDEDRTKSPRVQYQEDLPTFDCRDVNGTSVGKGTYHVGPQTNIETLHPIRVVHIQQKARTTYQCPIESTFDGFIIAMKGNAQFGGTPVEQDNAVLVLKNHEGTGGGSAFVEVATGGDGAEYLVATGERVGESWAKKLVASGAVIAATAEEARSLAPKVEEMSQNGKAPQGSFAPWGI